MAASLRATSSSHSLHVQRVLRPAAAVTARHISVSAPVVSAPSRTRHQRPWPKHLQRQNFSTSTRRAMSSPTGVEPPDTLLEGERRVFEKLVAELEPTKLEVRDSSGGCGSMYTVDIVSPKFAGIPIVKQHQLVNRALAEEIKLMHGLQMFTRAPQ